MITNSNDFINYHPSYSCYPFDNLTKINKKINDFKNDDDSSLFNFCYYGGDHENSTFGCKIQLTKNEQG